MILSKSVWLKLLIKFSVESIWIVDKIKLNDRLRFINNYDCIFWV